MRTFALTYPQLMHQAITLGLGPDELVQLRQAYELAERMADGLYRAQGMPFICHLVRTASIVLAEGQPVEVVVASLTHSAYMLHCFDDSCRSQRTAPLRRQLLREIPQSVEALIAGYDRFPWHSKQAVESYLDSAAEASAMTRQVLIMRLANELEDYLDLGMAFRGSRHPYRQRVQTYGPLLVELARRVGSAQLAHELRQAFDLCLAAALPEVVVRNRRDAYELPRRRWGQMGVIERAVRAGRWRVKRFIKNGHKRTEAGDQATTTEGASCGNR